MVTTLISGATFGLMLGLVGFNPLLFNFTGTYVLLIGKDWLASGGAGKNAFLQVTGALFLACSMGFMPCLVPSILSVIHLSSWITLSTVISCFYGLSQTVVCLAEYESSRDLKANEKYSSQSVNNQEDQETSYGQRLKNN